MSRISLNDGWKYEECFNESIIHRDFDDSTLEAVRLPHTCKELPLHYFNEEDYQFVCGYRKTFIPDQTWEGKSVRLTFDGVGHYAEVYLNGNKIGQHNTGYTAFTLDITKELSFGEENILAVLVDTRESINTPPFGFVVDYLTYGGIYREVYLDVTEKNYIADIFSRSIFEEKIVDENKGKSILRSSLELNIDLKKRRYKIKQSLFDGEILVNREEKEVGSSNVEVFHMLSDIVLWSVDNPHRYKLVTELIYDGNVIDVRQEYIGIRKIEFKADGFYLNDRKVKIRGLNRHQSYPYVGYAMPESMQRLDAKILKEELGCNAVRTSHYPQSQFFIDECDRLGLLVFTEMPGWQHIGNEQWKQQAYKNVEEMVLQYRNHPSIILWGVRINESKDDDEFYKKTNEIAHALDDSRPTGGVRCHKKSSMFEDVYTYNDFVHSGANQGCDTKKKITSDMNKAYLVSEYNGHMYPTKSYDWEEHRMEHMLRHARVLDAIGKNEDIAGSFGWCMFDYNTHKDFGSGDKICYHGVMDMFRNPKSAAAVYAIQQEENTVLEISSSMDIGEHPASNRGATYILSNADSVRMYKNGRFIKEFFGKDSEYTNLKNAPIAIDDYIGDEIFSDERLTKKQAILVKDILNHAAINGFKMTPVLALKALWCMAAYRLTFADATDLFSKYVGNWGGSSTEYRFDAIKGGEVVKTVIKSPMKERKLNVEVSNTELSDGDTYDVAAVRITMRDEYGNILPFYNDPVVAAVTGGIELIGPRVFSLNGGMGGTYVKTTGLEDRGKLVIELPTGEKSEIDFKININKKRVL